MIATDREGDFPIPQQHPCFPHHFPDAPVVPGALLLAWITARVAAQWPGVAVTGIASAKFLEAVHPGDRCRLHWRAGARADRLRFTCLRNGAPVLEGVLEVAAS